MTTPIRPRVKSVFLHVDDLQGSAAFYSNVLGFPQPANVEGPVFFFTLDGADLVLDSNVNNPKEALRPTMMFDTDDIEAAYRFLQEQGATLLTEIQRYPDVCFFNFQDPLGNVNMVCQELK